VLLILAGVSISMLTGENGVATNATKAKSAQTYSMVKEKMDLANMAIRTEIETKLAEDSSYNATKGNADDAESNLGHLVQIVANDLGITGNAVNEVYTSSDEKWKVEEENGVITITYIDDSILADESRAKQNGKVVTTITIGEQEVKDFNFDYVEQALWKLTDNDTNGVVSVGDLLTPTLKGLENEKFYVIADNGITLTLLAERCIDTSTNKQVDTGYSTPAFDDDSPVFDGSDIQGLVNAYANSLTGLTLENVEVAYNTEPVTNVKGRLMWYQEALNLKYSEFIYIGDVRYWLGEEYSGDPRLHVVRFWG